MLVIDLTTLGMLITNRPQGSAMSFVAWIVLGLVAGFIGSKLVNHSGRADPRRSVRSRRRNDWRLPVQSVWRVGRDRAESLQPTRGSDWRRSVLDRLSRHFPPQTFRVVCGN